MESEVYADESPMTKLNQMRLTWTMIEIWTEMY